MVGEVEGGDLADVGYDREGGFGVADEAFVDGGDDGFDEGRAVAGDGPEIIESGLSKIR